MTQLTKHFSLEELIFSDTAVRKGIPNEPTYLVTQNLQRLAVVLEKVRFLLGDVPMSINSGFRCPKLNAAVGGAKTSAHLEGRAADFTCRTYGDPLKIVKFLVSAENFDFDQIIQEGTWVHIGIAKPGEKSRRQVLTANFSGGKATYTEGV